MCVTHHVFNILFRLVRLLPWRKLFGCLAFVEFELEESIVLKLAASFAETFISEAEFKAISR